MEWVFRFYQEDDFVIRLYSGSVTKSKFIGTHEISASQLTRLYIDDDGILEVGLHCIYTIKSHLEYDNHSYCLFGYYLACVQKKGIMTESKATFLFITPPLVLPIITSNHTSTSPAKQLIFICVIQFQAPLYRDDRETGRVYIKFFIELGEEWDWFVFKWNQKENHKNNLLNTIKKFSKTKVNKEMRICFPLRVEILSISVFDLPNVHIFGGNKPYVVVNCGSVYEKTNALVDQNDSYNWSNLFYEIHLVSDKANIIFIVYSKSLLIGRYSINGEELLQLSRTTDGLVSIFGDLLVTNGSNNFTNSLDSTEKVVVGKISIQLQMDIEDNLERQLNSNGDKIEPVKLSKHIQLPTFVHVNKITVTELPSINILVKNSPQIQIACGNWEDMSRILQFAGQDGTWNGLNWEFPMNNEMKITLKIISDEEEIGYATILPTDIMSISRSINSHGNYLINKDIIDGKTFCGRIWIELSFPNNGDIVGVNRAITDLINKKKENDNLYLGYSQLPGHASPDKYRSTDISVISKTSSELVTETRKNTNADDDTTTLSYRKKYPIRITITNIIVTDLKPVHYLSKNSPWVIINVGTNLFSTIPIINAGPTAIWSDLINNFYLTNDHEQIYFTIKSKNSVIGTIALTSLDLLKSPIDAVGVRDYKTVIFSDSSRSTGKLKINFILELYESYKAAQQLDPIFKIRNNQLPITFSLYTITLINLRSVHPFLKNLPVVKVTNSNNEWAYITKNVDQYGANAKFVDINYSKVIRSKEELILNVTSGSILIGATSVPTEVIANQLCDPKGVYEIELPLLANDKQDSLFGLSVVKGNSSGVVKLTYSMENYLEVDSDNEFSDDEESYIVDTETIQSLQESTASIGVAPNLQIVSITLRELESPYPSIVLSPYIKIKCGNFRTFTKVSSLLFFFFFMI